jgi:hypothetical protein
MKNLFLLTTEKPSRLLINKEGTLVLTSNFYSSSNPQNIYITSDEEIKEGDWVLYTKGIKIHYIKITNSGDKELANIKDSGVFKIILTTDTDLIEDGVQAIDDEFLEWFVKNPSCESVELEKWTDYKFENDKEVVFFNHKIIIPKEEPKQDMKTAVEFLYEKIKSNIDAEDGSMNMNWLYDDTFQQAKEMEKQQIIDAFEEGSFDIMHSQQYYKETFNK